MVRLLRLVCALAILGVAPAPAHAGRTHFGWLYGSEIVPENGTEIETWIVEENQKGATKRDETSFWWGPVMGLTEHLELGISIEAEYANDHVSPPENHFTRWGAELRYRPQSPDRIDAGPLATLLRLGAKRLIDDRAGVRVEGDLVASYERGRWFLTADLGSVAELVPGATQIEVRPASGISVRVAGDVRLGIEQYSELIATGADVSWLVVGPNIAYTHGRFWGAAAFGIGLFGIRDAPRLTFGVAL